MNTRFLIAVLAALLISFFGGWLLFGIALSGYYESNATEAAKAVQKSEEDMVMWAMILGQLAWSIMVVWVVDKTGSKSAAKGAITGFTLYGLIMIGLNFWFYAMMDMFSGMGIMFVDAFVNACFGGVIGATAGWILGRGGS